MRFPFLCAALLLASALPAQQPKPGYRPDTRLLLKDPALQGYFRADSRGIFIYRSPQDKAAGRAEFAVYPDEYSRMNKLFTWLPFDSVAAVCRRKGTGPLSAVMPRPPHHASYAFTYGRDPQQPLAGLRVALDPGHSAGSFAAALTEGKYIQMKASPATGNQPIRFYEADLTLSTALLIQQKLEQMGATVLLTRSRPGVGAGGMSFETWLERRWPALRQAEIAAGRLDAGKRLSEGQIFTQYFNQQDLRERADRINAFHPHLTLIIHYNVHEPNWRENENGYLQPAAENYSMAFVPGAFARGELAEQEGRIALLRLLLTRDQARSILACEIFLRHSQTYTGVRPVAEPNSLPYLRDGCLYAGKPGVYARNLTLTRLVSGTLIYGESLCQDNRSECLALSRQGIEVGGRPAPARLQDVAKAYIATVVEFAKSVGK
jgi:N-acetylmuramoyl-L-alanine amidase